MKGAGIIIKKELTRVFSDKKLIFSLFILPAVLVIGIYSFMGQMMTSMIDDVEGHTSTVYIVNAPDDMTNFVNSVGYDKMANITYLDDAGYAGISEQLHDDMLNGNADLIVAFDLDFLDKITAYSKAGDPIPNVKLLYNSTENYSSAANTTFNSVIYTPYINTLLAQRLGNMELLTIANLEEELIVKEDKAKGEYVSMILPYLITMLLFAGAMSVGMDAIAGEKERGTLASMLLSPVSRGAIVVGKIVSLAILSGISALVYSLSMIVAMPMMGTLFTGGADGDALSVSFSVLQMVELVAIMLVMVYLYVAIISLLSVLAKNSKEAGTYISPIYIVVIVAGMMTMFTSGSEMSVVRYAIPIYGNALAIKDIVVNELTTVNFLATIGGTTLLALIVTVLVTKAFNSEKVMFNA